MDDQMTKGDFAPFLTVETLMACYAGLRLGRAEARERLEKSGCGNAAYLDWFDMRWPAATEGAE